MEIHESKHGAVSVVALEGNLDTASSTTAEEQLRALIAAGARQV